MASLAEQYKQRHPDQFTAATATTPAATPDDTVTASAAVAEPESLLRRSGRRGVQEVLAAPGMVPALYGLAGGVIDHYTKGGPWAEAWMSDEGKALIAQAEQGSLAASYRIKHQPESVLRRGLSSAMSWYEWGGDIAGVTNNPDGSVPLDEEVGGIALSTLATLPILPAKAVTLGTKAATLSARTALRAAEMATPLTLAPMGSSVTHRGALMGANFGVSVAINDATRAIMQEPTLAGQLTPGGNEAIYGSVTPVTGIPGEGNTADDVMSVAGAGAGLAALGMIARPGRGARAITEAAEDAAGAAARAGVPTSALPDGALSADNVPRVAPAVQRGLRTLRSRALDDVGGLVEDVRAVRGDDVADTFDDLARASSRSANPAAQSRFFEMGVLGSDGAIKAVPGRVFNQAYDGLTREQQSLFEIGMRAMKERDDRMSVRQPDLFEDPDIDADLTARINLANADPKVRQVMDMHKDGMRGIADLELAEGMIDGATHTQRAGRVFLPTINKPRSPWDVPGRVKDVMTPNAGQRQPDMQDGDSVINPMNVRDAYNAYTQRRIAEVNEMAVKRSYLQSIADAPDEAFVDGMRSVVRVRDAAHRQKLSGHLVTTMEGGRKVQYMVSDPRTAKMLEFRPYTTVPIMDMFRKVFQKATTGAWNPLFAPTSLLYDFTFGMVAANTARVVTGPLDQALKRFGAPPWVRGLLAPATRPFDMPFLLYEGLREGAHGRLKQLHAEHLAQEAARLGSPVARQEADAAAQLFLQSKYGYMHMQNYAGSSAVNNMEALNGSWLGKWGRNPALTTAGKYYMGIQDTIREAFRMGLFARNVAAVKMLEGDVTPAMYKRIARHVREVAADPSRRGTSDFVNGALSMVPYGGVMFHSTAHIFAQLRNPAAYAIITGMVAMKWYTDNMLSPEAQTHMNNHEPDHRRVQNLYFERGRDPGEAFDPAKHIERIPLGIELGTLTSMASILLNGMIREATGAPPTSAENPIYKQLLGASAELFGFATPPALNAAAAAFDKGPINFGAALDNRELFKQPFEDGGIEEFRGIGQNSGWYSDWMHHMVTAALGTTGRTISDAAEVMDSAVAKYDQPFYTAADDAVGVVIQKQFIDQMARYTLFPQQGVLEPLSSGGSNRAYRVDKALEKVTKIVRNLNPTISEPLDADVPFSKLVTEMPAQITDPALGRQAVQVKMYFGSPYHARQMDEIGQLRKSYRRMQGNTNVSRKVRTEYLNKVSRMMQQRYDIVLGNYGDFEQRMRMETGDPRWTLDSFADELEKHVMSQRY